MYCPHCGKQVQDGARFCVQCGGVQPGASPAARVPIESYPEGMKRVPPVFWSPLAIVAAVFALLSILTTCASPLAGILGCLALRELKQTPGMRGRGLAIFAIVVGVLGTLILLAVAIYLSVYQKEF